MTLCRCPNYFVDDPRKRGGDKTERDVLVRYDDVIVFVECKSRNVSILPSASHFKRYRDSLQDLIKKPFEQTMLNRSILEQGELIVYERLPGRGKSNYRRSVDSGKKKSVQPFAAV